MRRSVGRTVRGTTGSFIVMLMAVLIVAVLPGIARADETTDSTTETSMDETIVDETLTGPTTPEEPPDPSTEETIAVVPTVDTPEDDYGAGTDALVIGDGWAASEEVLIVITGSDGVEYLNTPVIADHAGHFELVFTLAAYYVPRYDVVAGGPSGIATTSFTDVALTLTNNATAAADIVFVPGETVKAVGTSDFTAGVSFKFLVLEPNNLTPVYTSGCLTTAQATSTGDTYTLPANAKLTTAVQWTFRAVRYSGTTCSAVTSANYTSTAFNVTKVFAFDSPTKDDDCSVNGTTFQPTTVGATDGCSDAKVTPFAAGATVYVRVLGYNKEANVLTRWRDPSNNLECANTTDDDPTAGDDRPDPSSAGLLNALQYVPVAPEVTDAACSPTSGADSGQWTLQLEPSFSPALAASANQTYSVFSVGNALPVATNDDASGPEDTQLVIPIATLLANDNDGGDGGALSLTAVGSATGGSVAIDGTNVEFDPTANLCGVDIASFEYTLSDTFGTDTGLVTIDLTCVQDPPVATDDDASGTEDTQVVISIADLIADDSDGGDGGALSITAVGSASGGSVAIDGTNVEFDPTANLCGSNVASFEYTLSDTFATDTGLVTIDLTCVNDAPVLTLPASASGQYSDNLATVNISATDVDDDAADLVFSNSASACGGTTGTLPASLSLTDDGDGTATITGQLTVKAGVYVSCIVVSDGTASATDTIEITVQSEDATVTPRSTNPAAAQAGAAGLPALGMTLVFDVQEKQPDLPVALAAAGDIDNAGLTVRLTPVAGGSPITLTCTVTDNNLTGYAEINTYTCQNTAVLPVNTYEVEAGIACISGNCFYKGVGWDAFTVFNPTAEFATGGGYIMLPTKNGPDEKVNFGFTMKYNKSLTSLQGNFIAIRHRADGTVARMKSNSLGGLVITTTSGPCGIATFNGKATYTAWDAAANGGLGAYVGTGNNPFSVYAKDCNNPGTGLDYLWMFAPGVLNMSTTTGNASVDKVVLSGGNISVPHRSR
jgi:hypothetical protein